MSLLLDLQVYGLRALSLEVSTEVHCPLNDSLDNIESLENRLDTIQAILIT